MDKHRTIYVIEWTEDFDYGTDLGWKDHSEHFFNEGSFRRRYKKLREDVGTYNIEFYSGTVTRGEWID